MVKLREVAIVTAAAVIVGAGVEAVHPGFFESLHLPWDHPVRHVTIDELYQGEHDGVCVPESTVGLEGLTITVTGSHHTSGTKVTADYTATQPGSRHALHASETGLAATEVPPIPLYAGRMIMEGNFGANCEFDVLSLGTGPAPAH